ncbi:basic leucine zipper transcriptional factor ATF-like [Mizuhopecten yessoensis]|uniref:Cyclic AMP-dependent transcription factor ATF-3 n=1 Tax=Mizuhopecten yessoensis TaxID=6573 RepID=A0A210QUQ3_MIZYE|nr:basic leucine zipper transcriptional factor ATF-like [Mizuhopecten yessoensis]OWF52436.1 Cyclic AMP-dependent transcription factor ATF-3 [Mizuhopecten yessoensis]
MLQRDTCSPTPSTYTLPSTSTPPTKLPPPHAQDEETLVAATLLALETGDLTPLIKEELKYTIQSRRVSEGKRELQVGFKQPQTYKLTDEEVERVDRRREQNRLAAQKFRRKQKAEADVHIKRIQRLESSNTKLKEELRSLREEKSQLFYHWSSHMSVCPARIETRGPDTPGFVLGQGTTGYDVT